MKKVVLVSISQPAINPRLYKDANALADAGFNVTVLYCFYTKWAWETDKSLLLGIKWKPVLVGGSPYQHKFLYFYTRARVKLFDLIARNITYKFGIAEVSRARAYYELLRKARKMKADIYIGHIQASLPIVVKAAKINNAKCGFDAEDFHRNEISDSPNHDDVKLKSYIEDKYLPYVNYISASSKQIADAYSDLYSGLKPIVINNVFSKSNYKADELIIANVPLKLFWFSQTLGPKRGLENLINALNRLGDSFELHLLGQYSNDYKNKLSSGKASIHFYEPISPDDIIAFARQFDIGLALEPGFSINNNLALSNKIFTYMQAGLAIVASDTKAQAYLLNQHPAIGRLFQKDSQIALTHVLSYYHQHRESLLEARIASLTLAQNEFNWETESQKLIAAVKKILAD